MVPLPFTEFLELLRQRGFGVGLQDYVAVGKLLDRWDRTDRDGIRDAIAALIAREAEEARDIRALFDQFYAEPSIRAGDTDGIRGEPRIPWNVRAAALLKRRLVSIAALAVLSTAVAAVVAMRTIGAIVLPAPPPPPQLYPTVGAVSTPDLDVAMLDAHVLTASLNEPATAGLPAPPRQLWWGPILWVAGGTALVTAAALWARRLRSAARDWTRRAWRRALADLPGPYDLDFRLRDLVTRLPKADVEEAATIIGRTFSRDAPGDDLDVRSTIRETLRTGRPQLVFQSRHIQEPVLVLQDVSQPMDPHAARVNGLLDDLHRQGVVLDRWYYDGDVSRPAPRPFAAPVPLEQLLRRRDAGPVMVISAGEGLHASVASPDSAWLDALAESDRRVWLTPVSDSRLWPAALQRVPLPIVPMTRRGLVEAASLLAHAERIGTGVSSRMVHEERRATTGDVRRIKRLASLVPFPTVSLLELLRQQFAEDVPEAAVIYATGGTTLGGDLPFRMTDQEIRDLTGEMRREQPALEAKVREYLLRVLHESEPPDGSAAHYRWEASTAIQQLQLARLHQTDSTAPAEAVRQLGRGPLWEEVRVALARQPAVPGLPTIAPAASPADPPPLIAVVSGTAPFKWRWPRVADLAASLGTGPAGRNARRLHAGRAPHGLAPQRRVLPRLPRRWVEPGRAQRPAS